MHLNVNHAHLNNNMHKRISRVQIFDVIHNDNRLRNMSLTINIDLKNILYILIM
jgi:hypothetical protein